MITVDILRLLNLRPARFSENSSVEAGSDSGEDMDEQRGVVDGRHALGTATSENMVNERACAGSPEPRVATVQCAEEPSGEPTTEQQKCTAAERGAEVAFALARPRRAESAVRSTRAGAGERGRALLTMAICTTRTTSSFVTEATVADRVSTGAESAEPRARACAVAGCFTNENDNNNNNNDDDDDDKQTIRTAPKIQTNPAPTSSSIQNTSALQSDAQRTSKFQRLEDIAERTPRPTVDSARCRALFPDRDACELETAEENPSASCEICVFGGDVLRLKYVVANLPGEAEDLLTSGKHSSELRDLIFLYNFRECVCESGVADSTDRQREELQGESGPDPRQDVVVNAGELIAAKRILNSAQRVCQTWKLTLGGPLLVAEACFPSAAEDDVWRGFGADESDTEIDGFPPTNYQKHRIHNSRNSRCIPSPNNELVNSPDDSRRTATPPRSTREPEPVDVEGSLSDGDSQRNAPLENCVQIFSVEVEIANVYCQQGTVGTGRTAAGDEGDNASHRGPGSTGPGTASRADNFEGSQRLRRLQQHFRGLICMSRSHLVLSKAPGQTTQVIETYGSRKGRVVDSTDSSENSGVRSQLARRQTSPSINEGAGGTTLSSPRLGCEEDVGSGCLLHVRETQAELSSFFSESSDFGASSSPPSFVTKRTVRLSASKAKKSKTPAIPTENLTSDGSQDTGRDSRKTKTEKRIPVLGGNVFSPHGDGNASPCRETGTGSVADPFCSSETAKDCHSTPLKNCDLALQHIVNTKEILRRESCASRPSAFVPTKAGRRQRLSNWRPQPAVPGLSEFDTRFLRDFASWETAASALRGAASCDSAEGKARDAELLFECYDELLEEAEDADSKASSSECSCVHCVQEPAPVDGALSAGVPRAPVTDLRGPRDDSEEDSVRTQPCPRRDPQSVEAARIVPDAMREVNGQLRGLLKKPNRPPPTRKNRVVFDETRNEFFEADYIILIREDCAYDEEDEEPCTCGEHELVRLCCEEGCQCNYTAPNEDTRTPQSPKFAPPIEFVDEAALSPPDGYKDNGLKNTLGGALSGHIFGAQHIQQLQVIQRLQQQRAAMLAARNNNQIPPPHPPVGSAPLGQSQGQTQPQSQPHLAVAESSAPKPAAAQPSPEEDPQAVCTECAECAECAAKQIQDAECTSPQCQDDVAQLGVPAVALLPLHASSPERRITQKEIIAGEERPKYLLQAQFKPSPVTERRIVREASEDVTAPATASDLVAPALPAKPGSMSTGQPSIATEVYDDQKPPPIPPKESSPTPISGILKGGKLWKQDSITQSDDQNNTTSEDEGSCTKRSVRFVTEDAANNEGDADGQASEDAVDGENQINELIPIKKHSTLFNNALRPNSAVRQLFPSVAHQAPVLTSEALRAFDESKRAGCLVPNLPGSGDTDTLRRSMERNILRRSLIKKKAVKSDISLEERIKQLTCDIDESGEDVAVECSDGSVGQSAEGGELAHRDSPTGEENSQKYANGNDKSFSPSSSVSSSSSGSSAYKKISDIFNRDKKQEKILEMEENPIVIIPQECRCPAAPDLGMGVQVPVVHTQIHRTPPRQSEPKRQFLSTLAPLTACVAGQKDDLSSYYTLAAAHHNAHAASNNAHFAEYNVGLLEGGALPNPEDMRKVAPDVIAGTPGQEQQDELAAFAQQEANRTDKIKKRYTNDVASVSSDDDEQNDYGFNKRPSVRGIKPKFSSTNEILQQMQDQLSQQMPSAPAAQANNQSVKSYTLPKQSSTSSLNKQVDQNLSPQNVPHPAVGAQPIINQQPQSQQQHQLQQQQLQQQQQAQLPLQANAITQQQTEQRTWSFYSESGEQQRLPVESSMQQSYYQTLPSGAVFRQTMVQHGQEESLMYAQNCQGMAAIEQQAYGHYARSPTRRPESPPPLRNYHQTMVLIPYNAETYSQFAAANVDPKLAHVQRQNILEYQQVTQQTIRVPIGYALPGMQLHVVAGHGHAAQYATHAQTQAQHAQQRILAPHYQFGQEGAIASFSERGVPEGAAAVSHSDCPSMLSPTTGHSNQPPQPQQQYQHHSQIPSECSPATVTSQPAPGSVYYAMNV